MAKARKEKLSIYLVKEGIAGAHLFLRLENAHDPIQIEVDGIQVRLFIKKDAAKPPPSWTELFTDTGQVPAGSFGSTRTVGAAAEIVRKGRVFVLTFGSGYHLLNPEAVERDFGLRVTLSSVDADKLRSVDKASYDDNPLNSRTQSSTEVDIFELQMDSELEMLYAITGASRISTFGSQVTGRDALTIMVETTLPKIGAILDEAFDIYGKPLPSHFAWIDNIRRVKDVQLAEILDSYLDDELAKPTGAPLWLGEPEIVNWESQIGYSFDLYANTPRHIVLKLDDLVEYLNEHGRPLNVATLKSQNITINKSDYSAAHYWSAYRCLYAEISVGSERYILRNGVWFQADSNFVKEIDDFVSDIESYSFKLPTYNFDKEGDYNEFVAANDKSFELMDKKNTKLGGQYDKIEFCDLVRNGTDLIHVKYYRSSSTLSHLFAQGFVAGEAFIKDEEFRSRLNAKLPPSIKLTDPKLKPKAANYNIVYAIATTKSLPQSLPFFSKVTLRNALRTLKALDYNVRLASIDVDPAVLVKKKCKPKPNAKTP